MLPVKWTFEFNTIPKKVLEALSDETDGTVLWFHFVKRAEAPRCFTEGKGIE